MREIVTVVFAGTGALLTLLAAVGLLRMPDVFTRMQAATKSATLGVACTMIAVSLNFGDVAVSARALLIIVFMFVTAPVAAHMIGRAAYSVGVALWEGTVVDELRDRYEPDTHRLRSYPGQDPVACADEDMPVGTR